MCRQLYVRAGAAHEIFGVSKTTFWRLTKTEGFPKKRRFGGASAYKIAELEAWADAQCEDVSESCARTTPAIRADRQENRCADTPA